MKQAQHPAMFRFFGGLRGNGAANKNGQDDTHKKRQRFTPQMAAPAWRGGSRDSTAIRA